MNKKSVISLIVIVINIILLNCFIKNQDQTISFNNLKNLNNDTMISMTKIEDDIEKIITSIPEGDNWVFDYDCKESATLIYDRDKRNVIIKEIKSLPLKCEITFTFDDSLKLYEKIANIEWGYDDNIDYSFPSGEDNGKGLYKNNFIGNGENGERVLFFRGNVTNNWVDFAEHKWRILRTTSDSEVKLISAAPINEGDEKEFDYNGNCGWTNDNVPSTANDYLNTWYREKLEAGYDNYLSKDAVFCNDKTNASTRYNNSTPSLYCEENDKYSVNPKKGNGITSPPIGLITMDEAMFAGLSKTNNNDSFLTNDEKNSFWTMTGVENENENEDDFIYAIRVEFSEAKIDSMYSSDWQNSGGIRPAIVLKNCVTVTDGDGSEDDPFVLSDNKC